MSHMAGDDEQYPPEALDKLVSLIFQDTVILF